MMASTTSNNDETTSQEAVDVKDNELEETTGIALGFAEECDDERYLLRSFFPSKVGGKPAWLNPKNLPNPTNNLKCDECGSTLHFLLQLYAPISKFDRTYHRTIYVFICRFGKCCGKPGSLKVFRSQLPQINDFYPKSTTNNNDNDNNNEEDELLNKLSKYCDDNNNGSNLESYDDILNCIVCGNIAPFKCSNCNNEIIRYCGRDHQIIHWQSGHKKYCKLNQKLQQNDNKNKNEKKNKNKNKNKNDKNKMIEGWKEINDCLKTFLFPTFEIISEPEPLTTTNDEKDNDSNNDDNSSKAGMLSLMRAYNKHKSKKEGKSKKEHNTKTSNASCKDTSNAECKDNDDDNTKTDKIDSNDEIGESDNDSSKKNNGNKKSKKIENESDNDEDDSESEWTEENLELLEKTLGKQHFDEKYLEFEERVAREPTQILRYAESQPILYDKNSDKSDKTENKNENKNENDNNDWIEPLWVGTNGILDCKNVPNCDYCGKARKFEFQIMPQLLYKLDQGIDGLDWGTIVIYSCIDSCGDGTKEYFQEFAHFQPSSAEFNVDVEKLHQLLQKQTVNKTKPHK